MKKYIIFCLMIILLLVSCSPKEDESDPEKSKRTKELANRIALFNTIEDTIELLEKKDYITLSEDVEKIFQASNKTGYIYNSENPEITSYISDLNNFAKMVNTESDNQKLKEIEFAYQKSMLKLVSSIDKKDEEQESGKSDEGSSEDSGSQQGEESSSSGDSQGGGESESCGGGEGKEEEIIIPEEELVKQYPELTLKKLDYEIKHELINLIDFTTKEALIVFPDNEKVLYNRVKYLFYQIESLCKLDRYDEALKLMDELNIMWQKIYTSLKEKDSPEAKELTSSIINIKNAITKKDYNAIKIQCDLAIETLETLANKKEEE